MTDLRNDTIGPLDLAIICIEKGRIDEALLHLGKARARLSNIMTSKDQLNVLFPEKVTRFEVIDYGRKDGARCFVTSTAKGGTISIQDDGRTAKLFLDSKA